MSIQHILVYVNQKQTAAVEAAFQLAKTHDAMLTTLFVVPLIQAPVIPTYLPDAETIASQRKEARERAEQMKKQMQLKADAEDVALNFVIEEGYTYDCIVDAAKYADVTVISKDEPGIGLVLIEDVLYKSGHPVLVIPENTSNVDVGHRVVIGWKPGAPAVRAVSAAMPILEKASAVTVSEVASDRLPKLQQSAGKVVEHLARHAVKAEERSVESRVDSTGLVDACRRANADLLVMGGYAHSRAREWVLGGVTHYMLENTPVALFLMH